MTMALTQVTTGGVDENINIDSNTLKVDGTNNRVGIGDAAPSEKLNVAGNVMLEGNDQFLYYTNVGTGNSGIYIRGRDATSELRSHSTGIFTWEVTGAEKMRIDSSGNLGIGVTNPGDFKSGAQNLVVGSGSGAEGMTIYSAANASGRICFADNDGASDEERGVIQYAHDDNHMQFNTDATERMRIDSSGDVEIAQTKYLTWTHTFGGTHRGRISCFANDSMVFENGSGNSERMRIDSSGNVGIGTSSPTQKLDVRGNIYVGTNIGINTTSPSTKLHINGDDGNFITLAHASRSGSWLIEHSGTNSENLDFRQNNGSTTVRSYLAGRDVHQFHTNGSERMRISSNGRVAIGSTSSDYKLYISGSGSSSPADQTLYMDAGSAKAVQLSMANGYNARQGVVFVNNGSASNTSFGLISENTSLDIKTASYAIGASSDLNNGWTTQAKFDNAGGFYVGANGDYGSGNYAQTSGNGNFYFRKDNGSNGGSIIVATNADRGWSNMYLNRFDWSSGDDSRYISFMKNGNGITSINLGSNGTTVVYNTGSDYRLKENIVPMVNGITRVKQLQPKQFTMIGDPNGVVTDGFLAHEAQTVVPVAVTGTHNAMTTDEDGNEVPDYQGMDYGQLTPLLTAALQEAIAKIETLETKVAALEAAE